MSTSRPSHDAARRISITAWVMAAFGTVAGELHALARIEQPPRGPGVSLDPRLGRSRHGRDPSTARLGRPDYVYWTYGKIWAPICLAFSAAAYLVYTGGGRQAARRGPGGSSSRAYALLTISVTGDYYTPWTDQFFIVGTGCVPVIGFGGPVLGISLLRAADSGHGPRPGC